MSFFTAEEERRHQLFNGPQYDPSLRGARLGLGYQHGRRTSLQPDDFAPIPIWAGRHVRAIPPEWLLWVQAQPWAASWKLWQGVADYLSRYPDLLEGRSAPDIALHVDPVAPRTTGPACFRKHGSCHLYALPLPGFPADYTTPYLSAFACGALGMSLTWLQTSRSGVPHYDLTPDRQARALQAGAALVDRRQFAAHIQLWRSHLGLAAPSSEALDATAPVFTRVTEDGAAQCTKHCYPDKVAADTVKNERLTGRHRRRNRPEYLRSYHCPLCGFWHLTSVRLEDLHQYPASPSVTETTADF